MAFSCSCADLEGDRGSGHPTLKYHKIIVILSSTGPDPLKNKKAIKPAFNVGPSSARQRNAILMAFCWQANDDPVKMVFGIWIISLTKKNCHNPARSDIMFWICACLSALVYVYFIGPVPGFMTFFLFNLIEEEISTVHKNLNAVKRLYFCFKTLRCYIYPAHEC